MFKIIDKFDRRANIFLFSFLHIILACSIVTLIYVIIVNRTLDAFDALMLKNSLKTTVQYLLVSLFECVGGAVFLDYVFKSMKIS